jgi:hypothetical protein
MVFPERKSPFMTPGCDRMLGGVALNALFRYEATRPLCAQAGESSGLSNLYIGAAIVVINCVLSAGSTIYVEFMLKKVSAVRPIGQEASNPY